MKTKPIPVIITLIAGFITCLVAFFTQINRADFVKILFFVLVGFYILGLIIKLVLDLNFKEEEILEEDMEQTEQGEEQDINKNEDIQNDGREK